MGIFFKHEKQVPIIITMIVFTVCCTRVIAKPGPEYLTETVEVKFTEAITKLAESLNGDPLKILNYVRNTIEFKPYFGSVKGAHETLLEKQGNDFDQASLLIALLRVSDIPARYVYGVVEFPIERARAWVGVKDSLVCGHMFASGGYMKENLGWNGDKITKLRKEHMWVEAWVTYDQYEGSKQSDSDKHWVPLDPSFKQYNFKEVTGTDINVVWSEPGVGWNPVNYEMPIIATPDFGAIINENQLTVDWQQAASNSTDWVTNPNNSLPTKTYQVLVSASSDYRTLSASLPGIVRSLNGRYVEIPSEYRYSFALDIGGEPYMTSLPELAGKQLTLSYIAASAADQTVLNSYDSLSEVPANQVHMKPIFQINHKGVLTGPEATLGTKQILKITLVSPSTTYPPDEVRNEITVGSYQGIGLDVGFVPDELLVKDQTSFDDLLANPDKIEDRDEVLGHILWTTAMTYQRMSAVHNAIIAAENGIAVTRFPMFCLVAQELDVSKTDGIPTSVQVRGVSIDVDLAPYSAFDRYGPTNPLPKVADAVYRYNVASAIIGSYYEHKVFEDTHKTAESMSAIKGIQLLNQQGVPTYAVLSETLPYVLPLLNHPTYIKTEIQEWITKGYMVFIPAQELNIYGRTFSPYFVFHRDTGAGGGMLNARAGGAGWEGVLDSLRIALVRCAADWAAGKRGTDLEDCGKDIIEALEEYSPAVKAGSEIAQKLFDIAEQTTNAAGEVISFEEQLGDYLTNYGLEAIIRAHELYTHVPPLIDENQYKAMALFAVSAVTADFLWSKYVDYVFDKTGNVIPGDEILKEAGSKLSQNFVGFMLNILTRTAYLNQLIYEM